MKNILYPMFIAIAAITAASCSVKEDMEVCVIPPKPGIDTVFVNIEFECIEIYDTGDREIVFDKVVDELELLFYDPDGKLGYDLRYTAAQLEEHEWEVWLYDDLVKAGNYTLLALVNYGNEHYTLTGKENLGTLLAGLEHEHTEIDFPLTDTYYGRYDLELRYDSIFNEHTVMLSKNTNLFSLKVVFQDQYEFDSVLDFESRITGNNTLYDWENQAINTPTVSYPPYGSEKNEPNRWYADSLKTMRVWHESDLKLEINITTTEGVHHFTQDISEWLAGIEKYDSDDKLEHYDEFEIKITLGGDFLIVAVQVNGWYVVKNGEDL